MIICPSCNAENADNANHCGNCGAQLSKGSGQKTMFGFAAVSPEALRQAAEDAKAGGGLPSPGLPKPGIPAPEGGLPKPNLPAPGAPGTGLPKPNLPGLSLPSSQVEDTGSSDVAKTEMLDAVPSESGPIDAGIQQNFGAPEPKQEDANPFAQTAPPGESELHPPGPSDGFGEPLVSEDPFATNDPFGATENHMVAPETMPEIATPEASSDPFGSNMPQAAPNNPMQPTPGGGGGGGGFGGGGGGFGGGGNYVRGEVRNPIMVFVLIMVTCGFYGFYWFFKLISEVNGGLGEDRFDPLKEFGLTIVTCGLWGYWFWWRLAEAIVELQNRWKVQPSMDAPILFITMLIGLGPFFLQTSLNNAWENGNPPA